MINHGRIQEMAIDGYFHDILLLQSPPLLRNVYQDDEIAQALYALDMGWSE